MDDQVKPRRAWTPEDYDEEKLQRLLEEAAQPKFDPEDWVHNRIDWESFDDDQFTEYEEWIFDHLAANGNQFPPGMEERQRLWPADSPMSLAELERELQDLLSKLKAVSERAKEIFDSLPDPPREERLELVPPSIYYELYSVLETFMLEELDSIERGVKAVIEATPEKLRTRWLEDCKPPERTPGFYPPYDLMDLIG